MPWEAIFGFANLYAISGWLVLAFAPKRGAVLPVLFYAGVAGLALSYAILIIALMAGFIDGGAGNGGGSPDFTTLAGIQALFATQGGATIGWIHYLAFDLFVGIWVARNADRRKIGRVVQLPILFFVLMAGPFGLILYLLIRQFAGHDAENSVVPS